jgi:2-dehydro-3-deoxyphosphogluconate aldolase / (4S)-4-hydroxy-2-oxoglutarate aldolase
MHNAGATALREQRRQRLLREGLVAVVRLSDPSVMRAAAGALAAGGVRAIEVTTTVPRFHEAIGDLRGAFRGDLIVGAGTLMEAAEDETALAAGAEFLVSPVLRPDLVQTGHAGGAPVLLGALTPTECASARAAGSDFVKLFPADVGGPSYVRALLAPMPGLALAPTGGVDVGNVAEFRRAGCRLAGIGGSLVSPALIASGDWAALTALARRFRAAWDSAA